jgi:hypothetical protein
MKFSKKHIGLAILTMAFATPCLAQSGNSGQPTAPAKPQAPSPTRPPTRVRTKLDGFDISPNAGKSANQVGGASRDLGTPRLLAPSLGLSFSANPVFYWQAAETGQKVTFRLTSANGQTLYELATTADHLRYPGDATPLTPGDIYSWTILPENDMLGGPPRPVRVKIIAGPEHDAIQGEIKALTDKTAIAEVFVNHRAWYDAIDSYSVLLQEAPADKDARAARANLYDQLPATRELADEEFKRAQ